MPIQRYRSIEEVPVAGVVSDDPAVNLRRVLEVSRLGTRLARTQAIRGVHRFATISEANVVPRRVASPTGSERP